MGDEIGESPLGSLSKPASIERDTQIATRENSLNGFQFPWREDQPIDDQRARRLRAEGDEVPPLGNMLSAGDESRLVRL
jgi:hypothetical protein